MQVKGVPAKKLEPRQSYFYLRIINYCLQIPEAGKIKKEKCMTHLLKGKHCPTGSRPDLKHFGTQNGLLSAFTEAFINNQSDVV